MKVSDQGRWVAFVIGVTAIGLAIRWGLLSWEERDFYIYHDWVGPGLTLSFLCLAGGALWAFYSIFPRVLHASKFISSTFAAVLFVATFATVAALAEGINKMGDRHRSAEMMGTLIRYTAGRHASSASSAGHFGVVHVENGPALEVPRSVLDKLKLKIGDKMPVSLHQGPLFDWGFIKPARSS